MHNLWGLMMAAVGLFMLAGPMLATLFQLLLIPVLPLSTRVPYSALCRSAISRNLFAGGSPRPTPGLPYRPGLI